MAKKTPPRALSPMEQQFIDAIAACKGGTLPVVSDVHATIAEWLFMAWCERHHSSPRVVNVAQRDFHKLSNYPLHRRRRVVSSHVAAEPLILRESIGQGLLRVFYEILERLAVVAEEETLPRIYTVPKLTFCWEHSMVWAEIEFTYFEILVKEPA